MRIRLSAARAADSLRDYLQRCGCIVQRIDDCLIEASTPFETFEGRLGRAELEAYLRVWQAMHYPDAQIELLEHTHPASAELVDRSVNAAEVPAASDATSPSSRCD